MRLILIKNKHLGYCYFLTIKLIFSVFGGKIQLIRLPGVIIAPSGHRWELQQISAIPEPPGQESRCPMLAR